MGAASHTTKTTILRCMPLPYRIATWTAGPSLSILHGISVIISRKPKDFTLMRSTLVFGFYLGFYDSYTGVVDRPANLAARQNVT